MVSFVFSKFELCRYLVHIRYHHGHTTSPFFLRPHEVSQGMPNIANQIGCFLAAQSHMEHLCGKVATDVDPSRWFVEATFWPGHPLRWFRHAQWLCQPPMFDGVGCKCSSITHLSWKLIKQKLGLRESPKNQKPADL